MAQRIAFCRRYYHRRFLPSLQKAEMSKTQSPGCPKNITISLLGYSSHISWTFLLCGSSYRPRMRSEKVARSLIRYTSAKGTRHPSGKRRTRVIWGVFLSADSPLDLVPIRATLSTPEPRLLRASCFILPIRLEAQFTSTSRGTESNATCGMLRVQNGRDISRADCERQFP